VETHSETLKKIALQTFIFGGAYRCYHIFDYFKLPSTDYISHELYKFKDGHTKEMIAFLKTVQKHVTDSKLSFDMVVRALGKNELVASGTAPLDHLGKLLAHLTGATYQQDYLKKLHVTPSLKPMGAAQRRETVSKAYAINSPIVLTGKRVLIVDDISTSGASLAGIATIIKAAYPIVKIAGFCLAKTKSQEFDGVSTNSQILVDEYNSHLKT